MPEPLLKWRFVKAGRCIPMQGNVSLQTLFVRANDATRIRALESNPRQSREGAARLGVAFHCAP
jgi:hypothetical protein